MFKKTLTFSLLTVCGLAALQPASAQANRIKVLVLGDSQSLEELGDSIKKNLATDAGLDISMVLVCGSSPLTWKKPYKQYCGYYEVTPQNRIRDIWAEGKDGKMKAPAARTAPSLTEVLDRIHPDFIISQQGDNLYPEPGKGWDCPEGATGCVSHMDWSKNQLAWMQDKLLNYGKLPGQKRKVLWVTPPDEPEKKVRGARVNDPGFESRLADVMEQMLTTPDSVVYRTLDVPTLRYDLFDPNHHLDKKHLPPNGAVVWGADIAAAAKEVLKDF